jgi:glycogen operon protein
MHPEDWDETGLHEFGLLLAGDNMGVMDFESRPIRDDTFYLIFNASRQNMNFILPRHSASPWEWIIDSTDEDGFLAPDSCHPSGETISVPAQSVQLFCEKPPRS